MPVFICALSTQNANPVAYALVEQVAVPEGRPSYVLREIGRFDERPPVEHLQDLFAANDDLVGNVTVVTQDGQRAAQRLHDAGLSAVPVQTRPPASRDGDTIAVGEQTVVDTFETVFRRARFRVPAESELAESAIRALYLAMSDDAGADDVPEHLAHLIGEEAVPEEADAGPDLVEQSGGATSLSTARVADDRRLRDVQPMSMAEVTPERVGEVDERTDTPRGIDLGQDHDVAMALAMAVWYGEHSADEVPVTDQAGESRRTREVRRARRQAARGR